MRTLIINTTKLALLALIASVISGQAAGTTNKETESSPLLGSNAKGDVIRWQDGTVWRDVTVTKLEISVTGFAQLELTNVPSRFQAGIFTNFASVSLRGETEPAPAVTSPSSLLRVYGSDGTPPPQAALAPLKTEFGDVLISDMPTDWNEAALVKPEFTATLDRYGKLMFGRFEVTVTHLAVEKGRVVCLVRATKKNGTFRDGWYSGVQLAIFSRETSK